MKKLESLEIKEVLSKEDIEAMELLSSKIKDETFALLQKDLVGEGIRVLAVNNGVLHPVVAPREFMSMSTEIDHVLASTENFTDEQLDTIQSMISRTNKVVNIYLDEDDVLEVEEAFDKHQEGIRIHAASSLLSMKEIFHYEEDIEDFTASFNLMLARNLMDKPNGDFIHDGKLIKSMDLLSEEERLEIEERKLEIEEELKARYDEDLDDYDDEDYDNDYDEDYDYYDDEDYDEDEDYDYYL